MLDTKYISFSVSCSMVSGRSNQLFSNIITPVISSTDLCDF